MYSFRSYKSYLQHNITNRIDNDFIALNDLQYCKLNLIKSVKLCRCHHVIYKLRLVSSTTIYRERG